jgi:hypothetical protein
MNIHKINRQNQHIKNAIVTNEIITLILQDDEINEYEKIILISKQIVQYGKYMEQIQLDELFEI